MRSQGRSPDASEAMPFIIRSGRLLAFHDLADASSPFKAVVGAAPVSRHRVADWAEQTDESRWLVELLNLSNWPVGVPTGPSLRSRPPPRFRADHSWPTSNRRLPTSQSTASATESRLATGAEIYGRSQTILAPHGGCSAVPACKRRGVVSGRIRPALRVTIDGELPPRSELIGRRVTRRMNWMFNYELLGQVHFWRDYLAVSQESSFDLGAETDGVHSPSSCRVH